jgi:ABC-type sulfate/molybdate transport systems ATPase subunit
LKLRAERATTTILVTHDADDATALTDRSIRLRAGEIEYEAPNGKYETSPTRKRGNNQNTH